MIINGKEVDTGSIEMMDVFSFDYPDFCDAFVGYAEFVDGTPLNEQELGLLIESYPDELYNKCIDTLEANQEG
jgi:hypothetical protein